ncbi:MAG: hypothetical protein R3C09_19685 [Pirellulaceae bacterium]
MSLSSLELWQRLADEGLATPEQCSQWASEILPKLEQADRQSGLKILQRIIELGYLSKYQAKIIAGQAVGPLRWGPWLVEMPVKLPLWQGWYAMRRGRGQLSWGRPVSASELEQFRTALPSMPRALKLAKLQHAGIAPVGSPELVDGTLLVFVTPQSPSVPAGIPLDGTLLSQRFNSQRCSPSEATRIASQLADALAALHKIDVPHGRVLPDRIYTLDQQIVLAIDPLCARTGLPNVQVSDAVSTGLIGHQLQPEQVAEFSAPELLLPDPLSPDPLPTPASDVYSLGCVWWWLITGETPSASGRNQTRAEPVLPTLPDGCALPEPQWLCLQACLARNPSGRFASAVELTRALSAAERAKPISAVKPKQQSAPAATPFARRHRKRQGAPWLWPILGGCGLVVGLLLVLGMSGILTPSPESQQADLQRQADDDVPAARGQPLEPATPIANDPRRETYEIIAAKPGGKQSELWAPPHGPDPLPLDLLPPGGQLFVSMRPAQWLAGTAADQLRAIIDDQSPDWLETLGDVGGIPLTDIAQVTMALYAPAQSGQPPRACWRFHLRQPTPLAELKIAWSNPTIDDQATPGLLVGSTKRAYFVASQPQSDTQSVSDFSVGPVELMRDVAELSGARGPLLPHLEKLWNNTDLNADLALLVSTPFLFTGGRELVANTPERFSKTLKQWLGGDVRGASLHIHWQPQWYLETRVVGTNDLEAGKLVSRQQLHIKALPNEVEQWLVGHAVHPYWRALALRYPQMLRTFVDYTRFGVEHGAAIMNCYLPSSGGTNLVLTSWLALQPQSTLEKSALVANSFSNQAVTKPLDIEAYLSQPIRLSFDSEAIEVALRMVGDEANANLPPGTSPLRFALDGAAFEKAGLTRNKQLRDYRIEQRPVRDALTEIAKAGNLVTTVTDLRQSEQTLIWIVLPDSESGSGLPMISLTTRAAATAAGHELPSEFAP